MGEFKPSMLSPILIGLLLVLSWLLVGWSNSAVGTAIGALLGVAAVAILFRIVIVSYKTTPRIRSNRRTRLAAIVAALVATSAAVGVLARVKWLSMVGYAVVTIVVVLLLFLPVRRPSSTATPPNSAEE